MTKKISNKLKKNKTKKQINKSISYSWSDISTLLVKKNYLPINNLHLQRKNQITDIYE